MDNESAPVTSTRKGATRFKRMVSAIVVVLVLVLAASVALIEVIPPFGPRRADRTRSDALTLRSAVELYMASGGSRCPSVRDLVAERIVINPATRTHDQWQHDFVIECHGNEFTVSSNGPDGRHGTEDDISTN